MTEIYMWVRQISMMAILSFLVLYLVDGKEKKQILRFLLSLFLLLIVLKPLSSVWNLEDILEQQLEQLSPQAEAAEVQSQIDAITSSQEETMQKEAERQIGLWVQEAVMEEGLIYEKGVFQFEKNTDREEILLKSVEITIHNKENTENAMDEQFKSETTENAVDEQFKSETTENAVDEQFESENTENAMDEQFKSETTENVMDEQSESENTADGMKRDLSEIETRLRNKIAQGLSLNTQAVLIYWNFKKGG